MNVKELGGPARLLSHSILNVFLFVASASAHAESVAFTPAAEPATGLKAIVQKWHDDELARQGGKFGSHGWWPWGLSAIDYDNDGAPDLIPSHHGAPGGLVLQNRLKADGKLAFANVTKDLGLDSLQLPQGIGKKTRAADFNGDGWLDFFGIRSPHYYNEGGKKFVPVGKSGFNTSHPTAIEDLNGDGHPDIQEPGVQLLFDPATREFKSVPFVHPVEARVPEELMAVLREKMKAVRFWRYKYFADFDLDGDRVKDVVISGYAGYNGHPLGFFLTAGAEGALADRTEAAGLPKDAAPILLADLDADGHVDLVSARGGGGIFLNDGKGKFTLKPGPATDFLRKDGPYLHVAYAEDFDADGDLDLVLVNPRHKSTAIFEHAGKGEFKCIHAQQSWDSDPIAIADFNADGRPDVAIGGPDTAITILLNAAATGNYCNLSLRMDAPNRFAAGARVEAFKAGELAKENALPFARFVAPADGFPIHLGLGEAKTFDLRVVFPGKESKPLTLFSVEARPRVTIAPAGLEEDSK